MNNQFQSILALSMRARKLLFGFDTVKEGAMEKRVLLVLTASDLSAKTMKEVAFFTNKFNVPHLQLSHTMLDLAHIMGKKTGILGVTDQGFAEKLTLVHNETEEPVI